MAPLAVDVGVVAAEQIVGTGNQLADHHLESAVQHFLQPGGEIGEIVHHQQLLAVDPLKQMAVDGFDDDREVDLALDRIEILGLFDVPVLGNGHALVPGQL